MSGIFPIKIYDAEGKLKKTYDQKEAVEIYEKNNKHIWTLTETEKRYWKGLGAWDKDSSSYTANIKAREARPFKYEIECNFCGKKSMKQSETSKYCDNNCRARYHQVPRHKIICQTCQQETMMRKKSALYCSRSCQAKRYRIGEPYPKKDVILLAK